MNIIRKNHIKTAWRSLWKSRTNALINVFGLALGLTCSLGIYLFVRYELNFDHFHSHAGHTFRVVEHSRKADGIQHWSTTAYPLAEAIRSKLPDVRVTQTAGPDKQTIHSTDEKGHVQRFEEKRVMFADENYLQLFDFKEAFKEGIWLAGNVQTAFRQPNAVVLTEWMALKYFTAATDSYAWLPGKTLMLNNTDVLQPLSDIHTNTLYSGVAGSYLLGKDILWGLMSLAVFLILIASVNFINLSTAQAIQRRKEIGVRKAVGSTRGQLFMQFMTETLILALAAGFLSFNGLYGLIGLVNLKLAFIDLDLKPDNRTWLFGMGLIGFVTLLAGFYPAWILSGFKAAMAMKNPDQGKEKSISLRQGLIVFQFGITYCLLVATWVASDQMAFFQNKGLGFKEDAILAFNAPHTSNPSKSDAFRQELLRLNGVKEVSLATGAPLTQNWYGTDFHLKEEPVAMARQAEMKGADVSYQKLFGLQMVAGQWLSQANVVPDSIGFNGFVINETMAKMLNLSPEKVIGKTLVITEGTAQIIGVVKDFHNASLQQAIQPSVFMYMQQPGQIHVQLLTSHGRAADLTGTLSRLQQIWKQTFPDDVFQYSFLNESLAKNYFAEQLVFDAFRIFAAISIFISCLGLFGLITLTAAQRAKEIGVRKVLGASVASVVGLLTRDFVRLIVLAIVLALPVSWFAMDKWLQGFAYKTDMHWWVFAVCSVLAVTLALFTVSFQSIKAALTYPVKSLKTE